VALDKLRSVACRAPRVAYGRMWTY
jgi:hypothetical protein